MNEPDDMTLIQAYAGGDEGAFGILYNRYRKQLYGYLFNLLSGNTADADEIFSETWIRPSGRSPLRLRFCLGVSAMCYLTISN